MDFVNTFFSITLVTLPYRILAYYPFRNQLRFPIWLITILTGASQLYYCIFYYFIDKCNLPVNLLRGADFLFAIICFIIFISSLEANKWKVLFIYMFIFDYITIIKGVALFMESHMFVEPQLEFYSIPSALLNFLIFSLTVPFMMLFLKKTKERVFQTDAPALWRVIWMLPAFTTIIVMMYTADLSIENVRQLRFLLSRVFLILGTFGIYYVLLQALDSIRTEAIMKEQAKQRENLLAF